MKTAADIIANCHAIGHAAKNGKRLETERNALRAEVERLCAERDRANWIAQRWAKVRADQYLRAATTLIPRSFIKADVIAPFLAAEAAANDAKRAADFDWLRRTK